LKAANFVPVKWVADGLGIILQVKSFKSKILTPSGAE
jgi:hypothetical protein